MVAWARSNDAQVQVSAADLLLSVPTRLPVSVLAPGERPTTNVLTIRTKQSGEASCTTKAMSRQELLDELNADGNGGEGFTNGELRLIDPSFTSRLDPCVKILSGNKEAVAAEPGSAEPGRRILVSLGRQGVGALILSDRLVLLGDRGDSVLRSIQRSAVRGSTRSQLPFQLVGLEAVLMGACCELHVRTVDLQANVSKVLTRRASAVFFALVTECREIVNELKQQSAGLDNALSSILAEVAAASGQAPGPPSELELLLEAYLGHVRSALGVLDSLDQRIRDQEINANLELDRTRNSLIKLEIMASTSAAAAGIGSCVAGIFGMNLPILHDDDGIPTWAFFAVSAIVGLVVFVIIAITMVILFGRSWADWCANAQEEVVQTGPEMRQNWKKRFDLAKSVRFAGAASRRIRAPIMPAADSSNSSARCLSARGPTSEEGL